VPAYAELAGPAVGAFIGAPIERDDGYLFGVLSGFDLEPAGNELEGHLPLVEAVAAMLGRVWGAELRAREADERADRAEAEARRDAVTGVASRRSWDELLESEEVRCRRHGHPASVLLADLDGLKRVNDEQGHAAGDRLLRRAARAIASATRSGDVVARLGGDEFGILAVESDDEAANALAGRVREALELAGVEASVGLGTRQRAGTLQAAWASADEAMYQMKRGRGRRDAG
jgi:diguanylate cyclase (GGDEF)-like protein